MKDIEYFVIVTFVFISFTLGVIAGMKSGRKMGHEDANRDAIKAGHAQYIPGENGEATFEWLNPCNK